MSEQKLPTEDQPRDARVITGGQILDILSVCGEPEVMDIDDPAQKVRALIDAAIVHRALIAELVGALGETRKAIASLDEWALGGAVVEHTDGGGIADQYPIRDELLSNIDAALAKAKAEIAP